MTKQPKPVIERLMARVKKEESGCWVLTGYKMPNGYMQVGRGGRGGGTALAHRVAYEEMVGTIPEGGLVDHLCFNRACINPEHLRLVSHKQNMEHRKGPQRNNKLTGIRGVSRVDRNKPRPWVASVGHEGAKYHLGYFATAEEAEAAVCAKRAELFTHDDHHEWQQQEVR